jgi:rhamnose utilization protein RhaD (predicted bifunctional aldolase and dehydrogenase)
MITQEDRRLYKKLSILFGAFHELIQGAGGNISIKSKDQILLKSSGTCLSEATEKDGFVLCNLSDMEIVDGTGNPSMEFGFHLLPKRIIVHFHSLSCLTHWNPQISSILTLPYIQPGDKLSVTLHSVYTGQSILNLENHGIILFAETEDEIYSLLASLYPDSFLKVFHTIKELYEVSNQTLLEIPNAPRCVFFNPYTPDVFLFLKRKPLCLRTDSPVQEQISEYIETQFIYPSIFTVGDKVFCIATSWKKCILIRDMYDTYFKILKTPPTKQLTDEDCSALLACEKEAYRLR